ncbi:bacterial regulatory s, luxR family protein [Yersinia pseudotuberculosis IP 32953]|uniref:LuxR family transcriptional regulator n=34 Tax=Yersinia pseudotuberculosis complex TaxID=1649845 RepID=A0ABM7AJL5_YERPU|nr:MULTISPECIES: LuxR family transcriptional regulator [Yersinia pseudotuberculosis complex]CQD57755.1 putative luxR-family regulatory protein [Yersinia intermedia]ABS48299.1 transcriptional regulator, LuxR family [Yersinia pseudotuberculosis IP 31758]AIN15049.1 bacterial regulatory s, luxR family protein [Yersinia pseudotuberculosis]AJJ04569.1 bacterial regulatory s, luxR family protein [Yersinia pseudotuberculosis]AJJ06511.1 bacterial regulatory s, luxR family protein [Yersinia pseudotubercu
MFSVAIKTRNAFYEFGLLSLLKKVLIKEDDMDYSIVPSHEKRASNNANVIFKDLMVIVNIYQENSFIQKNDSNNNKPMMTVNIPFNSSQLGLYDVISKIKKILNIARLNYNMMMKSDLQRRIGLKNYIQLSMTESKVVQLTGKGHSTTDISKILDRSEKTILTHRRNAIRKLGMFNRLEFYKYASLMRNYSNKDAVFICL